MVYTDIYDISRTHFLYLSSNYSKQNLKIGTTVNIKTYIPKEITNNYYKFNGNSINQNLFNRYSNMSHERFKNLIILSAKLNDIDKRPICLLTQQNLFHNIKIIHSDFLNINNPKILFLKYSITNNVINNKQYLFNPTNNQIDLTNINLTDISLNIDNTDTDINDNNGVNFFNLKRLLYNYNFYNNYNKSDYYNIHFSDFIDLSFVSNNFTYDNLKYKINTFNIFNNLSNNQLYNYDINNYTTLFYTSDFNTYNILNYNIENHFNNDNILLYNTYQNITTLNLDFIYYLNNDNIMNNKYKDICINFVVSKQFNFFNKHFGKIYLTNNFTYIYSNVLNYNSNFYNNNTYFNNKYDNGFIFLSLGNATTGFTQGNLTKNIKFDLCLNIINTPETQITTYTGTNKINFYNYIDYNIDNSIKNTKYLLDMNYNFNYDNILYNNVIISNIKINDLNLNNFYHSIFNDFSYNIYLNQFQNLTTINNFLNNDFFFIDNDVSNNTKYYISNISDISYNLNNNYKILFNGVSSLSSNALTSLYNVPLSNLYNYDFRYNYSQDFFVDTYFNLFYNYKNNDFSFNQLNFYKNKLLLTLNKIQLTSYIITAASNDFKNVNCIFIYHDPYSTNTPAEFRYPNNNIEITTDPTIDTLARAIELLPGARTSTTNSVFIPDKNGSNLSRKHIQGLIGFNDIPKLLSIEPYDKNFIQGRGFVNQFQIDDTCKSYTDQVIIKLNSQKHYSAKENLDTIKQNKNIFKPLTRKQNFANIVRSKNIKRNYTNISKLEFLNNCIIDPSTIKNYYTPFKFYK